MTIQDKEKIILGTIINCNKEIMKLNEGFIKNAPLKLRKLFESKQKIYDIYQYNMVDLFAKSDDNFDGEYPNAIKLTNNNYYAYFKKVLGFLNEYELPVQKSLNESLKVNSKKVKNPIQLNILTFKDELKKLIFEIEKQNDVRNYSDDILSIKIFAKQPLFVCGFNIMNNLAINTELQKFKVNIFAIVYNKSNKQLIFVSSNSNQLLCYDIEKDVLDWYQTVNEVQLKTVIIKPEKYLITLKEIIGYNNLLEIYVDQKTLNLKYTDNLYKDTQYVEFRKKLNEQLIKGNSTNSLITL